MSRLTQSVRKYRKHRASGQAFVELNAKRHYLGPHGTKVEAFYAGLQKAVNEVDWQNVKLPVSTDWKTETSVPAEDWGEISLE